jgi:hypothetical protein
MSPHHTSASVPSIEKIAADPTVLDFQIDDGRQPRRLEIRWLRVTERPLYVATEVLLSRTPCRWFVPDSYQDCVLPPSYRSRRCPAQFRTGQVDGPVPKKACLLFFASHNLGGFLDSVFKLYECRPRASLQADASHDVAGSRSPAEVVCCGPEPGVGTRGHQPTKRLLRRLAVEASGEQSAQRRRAGTKLGLKRKK